VGSMQFLGNRQWAVGSSTGHGAWSMENPDGITF